MTRKKRTQQKGKNAKEKLYNAATLKDKLRQQKQIKNKDDSKQLQYNLTIKTEETTVKEVQVKAEENKRKKERRK